MIPGRGDIIAEISKFEERLGDPIVEAYEEVQGCSLTCKICKSASCNEVEQ